MDQKEQKKLLGILKKEETEILSELSDFAQKDTHIKGEFVVPFPNEGNSVDENAREIQEFERLNILKNNLTKRLRDIKNTIGKIEQGEYGKCGHCAAAIGYSRLQAIPMASLCIDCAKQDAREP